MTDDNEFGISLDGLDGLDKSDQAVPPGRWAVPATAMPQLPWGTLATVPGPAGRGWVIDAMTIAEPAPGPDGQDGYLLVPMSENVAARRRGEENEAGMVAVMPRWEPTESIYIYRDESISGRRDKLPEPPDWLSRVGTSMFEPPTLRPRPASELPSFIGRRMRGLIDHKWVWCVPITEPYESGDDISVDVVRMSTWPSVVYGDNDVPTLTVAAHRLFAY